MMMHLSDECVLYERATKHMVGQVYREEPAQSLAPPTLRAEYVKFVCGGHTQWHRHTGEQMLLITGGEGFVEIEGHPRLEVRTGARVHVPACVRHRHGALKDETMVHLAVTYGRTLWEDDEPCVRNGIAPTNGT